MRVNAYLLVFGVVVLVVVAAGVSAFVSYQGPAGETASSTPDLSNLQDYGHAANFVGIAGWINSPPLNITGLRGKVVLVDFWTYSCINCIRTIPYLNEWYAKYGGNGFVIVGVHTPEFSFERNYTNVLSAVRQFGIKYPVALDSNYSTWNAYNNRFWPADYLIDKNGNIRDVHVGEGGYNSTEETIQELLQNAGYSVGPGLGSNSVNASSVDFDQIETPEIYLGYNTARFPIGNAQGFSPGEVADYSITKPMQNNTVYLSGPWFDAPDSIISSGAFSEVFLVYHAKSVNIVAQGNSTSIMVLLDGKNISPAYAGSDLTLQGGVGTAVVDAARLYNLVSGPSYGWHTIEIVASPGVRIYTFTFG